MTDVWPPGQRPGAKPATRFDLPKQYYFNMTHMFFPDDFNNIRKLKEPELLDIEVRNKSNYFLILTCRLERL